jgi:ADP-ribosylglycohydrolase
MLGAIIGDIVGSRWEFNPTNNYDFEWLSSDNAFTDDTICTVGVADALLINRDFGESIHDWCRRYPCPMGGYGGRFAQWVLSDNPQPYNSFGNGSAMRVSPVAHWYKSLDEVLDAAAATALPSHNHDEGIKGAQTVAMAIFRSLQFVEQAPAHIDEILS